MAMVSYTSAAGANTSPGAGSESWWTVVCWLEVFGASSGAPSVDGSFHFRHAHLEDPFVVAGYSLFFNCKAGFFTPANQPHLNLFNFGGEATNLRVLTPPRGPRSKLAITCISIAA